MGIYITYRVKLINDDRFKYVYLNAWQLLGIVFSSISFGIFIALYAILPKVLAYKLRNIIEGNDDKR